MASWGCVPGSSDKALYFASERPGLEPVVFAPAIISKKDRAEYGSVFSKDGTEFYFAIDLNKKSSIWYSKLQGESWTEPTSLLSNQKYSYNDPFLSPDERKLYYISDQPRDAGDTIKDIDIWYSEKTENGWSAPINAGRQINSDRNEYYISFTNNGAMYFASNAAAEPHRKHDFDIYSAAPTTDGFATPQRLSDSINTRRYEADVFVAPNESYLIFCTARKEGLGKGDLYISFKNERGVWQKAKNMGPKINSEGHELCPYVTSDNKYFFYTSNQDIYWVSTAFLEQFR